MNIEEKDLFLKTIKGAIKLLYKDDRKLKYKLWGTTGQIDNFTLASLTLLCLGVIHIMCIVTLWLFGKTIYTPLEIPTLTLLASSFVLLIGVFVQLFQTANKVDDLTIGYSLTQLDREVKCKKYIQTKNLNKKRFKKSVKRTIEFRESRRNLVLTACAFISVAQLLAYGKFSISDSISSFLEITTPQLFILYGALLTGVMIVTVLNSNRIEKLKAVLRVL